MNIANSFAQFIDSSGFGTLGTDIFIGGVPQDAPDKCWWVVTRGGSPEKFNQTGEVTKNYILDIYYRNTSQSDVYDKTQELEELVNGGTCTQLTEFDTLSIEAILFSTDQDIDNQDRTIGLVQVNVKTYYKE